MASIKPRFNKHGKTTSWQYVISNYPEKNIRKGGFKRRGEAEAEAKYVEDLLKKKKKWQKAAYANRAFLPFHIEFEKWYLADKTTITDSTLADYKNVKNKIQHFFDDALLINITEDMYKEFMSSLKNNAKSTNEKIHKKINAFTKYAYNKNLIKTNFAYDIKVVGKTPNHLSSKYLSVLEYPKLTMYLEENESMQLYKRLMLLIDATTGIRYGELCGITLDSIDFERNMLQIDKQWDYKFGSGFKSLKDPLLSTRDEKDIQERFIPVPKKCMELIKKFIDEGHYIENPHKLLFFKKNTKAKVVSNNTFNDWLKKINRDIGISLITAHGLRHSYATFLASNKTDKRHLQYLMGHKDIKTTEQYYIHLHQEMFINELSQLDNVLNNLFN